MKEEKDTQGCVSPTNMRVTLPALVAQANFITERLIENEGEVTPELDELLTIHTSQLAQKVDSYAVVMERLESEAEYWRKKSQDMAAKAKAMTNAQERIKDQLKAAMQILSLEQLAGEHFSFKLSKSRPKLSIDATALPADFKTQTIVYEPDKDKIADALNSGLDVPGAEYVPVYALRKTLSRGAK